MMDYLGELGGSSIRNLPSYVLSVALESSGYMCVYVFVCKYVCIYICESIYTYYIYVGL